jgi:murein DD-endopeptidase
MRSPMLYCRSAIDACRRPVPEGGMELRVEPRTTPNDSAGRQEAHGVRRPRRWPIGPVCLLLAGLHVSAAAAQIPPSVEVVMPKAPELARSDAGAFVAYELHVTNLTPQTLVLERVEVVDDRPSGGVLATVSDSALLRSLARPGVMVPADERGQIGGGLRAVVFLWVSVEEASWPAALRHRLHFRRADEESARYVITAAAVPVAPAASPIGPPLRGEWLAANGPSNETGHRRTFMSLHGRTAIGQRFATDYLQVDLEGRTFSGERARNESYYAYGQDALAVADGVVVDIHDGIPDNVPGPTSRAVPITLETVAGNYTVIDIGGGRYAFYAHLIPGSVRVAVGDRVRRGQVLGLVGNSGNSTEPHLHFHIADAVARGTATLGAEGLPYVHESFELLGGCVIYSEVGCERHAPFGVERALPTRNQLVRFPER